MRYLEFTIHEYRGISSPITVKVDSNAIVPIVGVNECGKTTILEAILAFDSYSDKENRGRHLEGVENLFSLVPGNPRVSARIECSFDEVWDAISEQFPMFDPNESKLLASRNLSNDNSQAAHAYVEFHLDNEADMKAAEAVSLDRDALGAMLDKQQMIRCLFEFQQNQDEFPSVVEITRDLTSRSYTVDSPKLENDSAAALVADRIIANLGYILYFDDFRHDVPPEVNIGEKDADWTRILEMLFHRADPNLSVYRLPLLDERKRNTSIARAEKHLNGTLTSQWQRFHLEESDALKIRLRYSTRIANDGSEQHTLKFEVVQTDHEDNEIFFNIKDRSKGFFWFFNFVMRLEFNPKTVGESTQTIYLLDEPGSYLHSSAQTRLCQKIRDLSTENAVIYCTHSHHLLDPQIIPFGNISIAEKNAAGEISLDAVFHHREGAIDRHAAFQPILDALQVRPSVLDMSQGKVLVAEGMRDFFAYDLFKPKQEEITVIPSTGASSLRYLVSLLIAWRTDYFVLWDNDGAGRKSRDEAERHFGAEEARLRFRLLPIPHGKRKRKRILQDLFFGDDIRTLKGHLGLPNNTSFNKVLLGWYYSPQRDEISDLISATTKSNFSEVFDSLWRPLSVQRT